MATNKTEMVDLHNPRVVQIQISADGGTLWVNVDGQCAFRATRIVYLELEDNRPNM